MFLDTFKVKTTYYELFSSYGNIDIKIDCFSGMNRH